MKYLLIASVSLIVSSTVVLPDANAQRRLDEYGAGNCIFAGQPLPFGKEGSASYRNRKETFEAADDIYARCYYNGTVASHKKHGRLFNSLRNDGHYFAVVSWVRPLEDGGSLSHGRQSPVGNRVRLKLKETASWNQQSFYLTRSGDCDLTVEAKDRARFGASGTDCIDFSKLAKARTKEVGLPPQPKAKFCMEVVLVYANKTRKRWVSDSWVTEQVKNYRKMSGGCFFVKTDS